MILVLFFFILFALPAGWATDDQITTLTVQPTTWPRGAVLLVVDGMGASYIYPEYHAYRTTGQPLPQVTLLNLTGAGARVLDVRALVTSTGPGHSALVTGQMYADEISVGTGRTLFDALRDRGYLCLALLQRGDFQNMLQEQDGVVYFEDNSLCGDPTIGSREDLPPTVQLMLQQWKNAYASYSGSSYARYNLWGLDAAADLVSRLDQPFLLLVNLGGADSAGHNQGADLYLETVSALDAPLGRLREACLEKNVLLGVTADHGMSFSGSRGGHASEQYSQRTESLRIPLVFIGSPADDMILDGIWSQAAVAPTLLRLLGIDDWGFPAHLALPVGRLGRLTVLLPEPGTVELIGTSSKTIRGSGSSAYRFDGLERGSYTVKALGTTHSVDLIWDQVLDQRGGKGSPASPSEQARAAPRWLVGSALIILINIAGLLLIWRVWQGG